MNVKFKELGELPPPIVIRTDADNSHFDYLKNKNKPEQ